MSLWGVWVDDDDVNEVTRTNFFFLQSQPVHHGPLLPNELSLVGYTYSISRNTTDVVIAKENGKRVIPISTGG